MTTPHAYALRQSIDLTDPPQDSLARRPSEEVTRKRRRIQSTILLGSRCMVMRYQCHEKAFDISLAKLQTSPGDR
jgi:hypothetical protein